jgi:hypothetical protein
VAAIRLIDRKEGGGPWPDIPTSEQIYDYVGVSSSSIHATGAMWETLFIKRAKKSVPNLEFAEVCLVGRCLEKVLQVDIVPATIEGKSNDTRDEAGAITNPPDQQKQEVVLADPHETAVASIKETALVSNLFVQANVDLKSLL